LIGRVHDAHTDIVRTFLGLAAVVVFAAAAPASGQTQTSADVVALQRVVFGIGTPALPETLDRIDAQLRLAEAYASGTGIALDIEMGCGLAEIADRQSLYFGDDHPTHLRATAVRDAICANARDLVRSLTLVSCPHFGVVPETLEYGPGAWLTITNDGWTVEDASSVHQGEWALTCWDVLASVRLVRVDSPPGSRLRPRQFIEMLVWHQSYRDDGTTGPRSLEWYADELRPERRDIHRLASETIVLEKGELIWPTPPVPEAVAGGATFTMLRNGDIRWRFERAPELGTGTIERLRP